jgi:hypothetical protein
MKLTRALHSGGGWCGLISDVAIARRRATGPRLRGTLRRRRIADPAETRIR